MSEHRHRRRRRTSGFDLVRLYENDDDVLDQCVRGHRQGVVGWTLVAVAVLFSLLLVCVAMFPFALADGERLPPGDHWATTPPGGSAEVYYPPDTAADALTSPVSGVILLVVIATLIASALHLALGREESAGYGGSGLGDCPVPGAVVADPSAFQRRLDDMVCIKMSRRPQTHRHGHRR